MQDGRRESGPAADWEAALFVLTSIGLEDWELKPERATDR